MYADKITKIANALTNQNFGGTYSIDCLPQHIDKNSAIIINTHSKNLPGEHWIAVYRKGQYYYIFDPLGFYYPSKIISHFYERGNVNCNKIPFQPLNSKICGELCIYWIVNQMRSKGNTYVSSKFNLSQFILDF